MKRMAVVWILLGAVLLPAVAWSDTDWVGHVTADDRFGLYTADRNGNGITFHGRNEVGQAIVQGLHSWSVAETLSFDLNEEEYVYITAWDHGGVGGLLGEFTPLASDDRTDWYTDTRWEVARSTLQEFANTSALPSAATIATEIAAIENANAWNVPFSHQNNAIPWIESATIPNVAAVAEWIWYDDYSYRPLGDLLIFRSSLREHTTAIEESSWGKVKELFR